MPWTWKWSSNLLPSPPYCLPLCRAFCCSSRPASDACNMKPFYFLISVIRVKDWHYLICLVSTSSLTQVCAMRQTLFYYWQAKLQCRSTSYEKTTATMRLTNLRQTPAIDDLQSQHFIKVIQVRCKASPSADNCILDANCLPDLLVDQQLSKSDGKNECQYACLAKKVARILKHSHSTP